MKKFKFKLETVLRLRQKVLEDRMLELARITGVLNDAREKLNSLSESQNKINDSLIQMYSKNEILDLKDVEIKKNYLFKLAQNMKQQEYLIIQIKQAVTEKQNEVREALKDKNIIEKLKEKQLERYKKEFDRKETAELDDMAINRYKAG